MMRLIKNKPKISLAILTIIIFLFGIVVGRYSLNRKVRTQNAYIEYANYYMRNQRNLNDYYSEYSQELRDMLKCFENDDIDCMLELEEEISTTVEKIDALNDKLYP